MGRPAGQSNFCFLDCQVPMGAALRPVAAQLPRAPGSGHGAARAGRVPVRRSQDTCTDSAARCPDAEALASWPHSQLEVAQAGVAGVGREA